MAQNNIPWTIISPPEMIKKPINFLFKNSETIVKKLKLDLKLRPQNLSPEKYFEICREYESLL